MAVSSFDRSASQLLLEMSAASSSAYASSPVRAASPKKRRSFMSELADDLQNFHSRFATFTMSNWVAKPADVSPVYCARYGWICVEKDLLQCISCKQYLSSHLPPPAEVRLYRDCADHLKTAVIDAHDGTCLWKSNPTPLDTISPNVLDREEAISGIRSRFESLKSLELQSIRFAPASEYELSESELQAVAAASDPPLDVTSFALPLAILGWKRGAVDNTIYCDGCLRTVGLWQFANDTSVESEFSSIAESRKRRRVSLDQRQLNPAEQHQSWCVWVIPPESPSALFVSDAQDENVPKTLARWKVALTTICRSSQPRTKSHITDYILAKQLLEETIALIEENERTDDSVGGDR